MKAERNQEAILEIEMHANMWNLVGSKERLDIQNRTEAQKKHLLSILAARTKLDTHATLPLRRVAPEHPLQRKFLQLSNESMVKRIVEISKPRSILGRQTLRSSSVSQNLRTYSSLHRTLREKAIAEENGKMFGRLMTTGPTLGRQQWRKVEQQTAKYKQNLHRSKYLQPDYSQQACKLINKHPRLRFPSPPICTRIL